MPFAYHIVHVHLSGLEGALLNSEMGCAPLLFLRCSELFVDSRYTCDQMHAVRLNSSLLLEYAHARKGVKTHAEPSERCKIRRLVEGLAHCALAHCPLGIAGTVGQ